MKKSTKMFNPFRNSVYDRKTNAYGIDCRIFEKACYHYKLLLKCKTYVYHKLTVIFINTGHKPTQMMLSYFYNPTSTLTKCLFQMSQLMSTTRYFSAYPLSQWLHWKRSIPTRLNMCAVTPTLCVNLLRHTVHCGEAISLQWFHCTHYHNECSGKVSLQYELVNVFEAVFYLHSFHHTWYRYTVSLLNESILPQWDRLLFIANPFRLRAHRLDLSPLVLHELIHEEPKLISA